MKVLVYGEAGGSGGYVRYCRGLFGSGATPLDWDVCFCCSTHLREALGPLDANVRIIADPSIASRWKFWRCAWHLVKYPLLAARFNADLEFYPAGYIRPPYRRVATVATCHNLLLFDMEELRQHGTEAEQRVALRTRKRQSKTFSRASGVIFLNPISGDQVMKAVPGIKERTIISHGLDQIFRRDDQRAYNLEKIITVLYVSSVFSYKHHPEVVQAIMDLRHRTGLDIRLRLIGRSGIGAGATLDKTIRKLDAEHVVTLVDEMDTPLLVDEYRQADLFCFASSCETFGITLVEAMAARLPIACSNRSDLPHILRDAGIYFDPTDPSSIAGALETLISDEDIRRTLGERASTYSQDYTWRGCAEATVAFLQRVYKTNDNSLAPAARRWMRRGGAIR